MVSNWLGDVVLPLAVTGTLLGGSLLASAYVYGYSERKRQLQKMVRTHGRNYAVQDIRGYDGLYRNILTSDIPVRKKITETVRLGFADFILLGTHLAEYRFMTGKI
jgi:hypothetical protein